ncbi:hypothetical protein SAMN05421823_11947 [Catalinimonas alkaloidigena]|uniref:Uncharacterized protein n=1 Tax=Catalinimonas alkaloidigena TaxID=1075417 RepID=A0A1G9V8B3_9BACT|nr:hypothetical protein [Catalinimonas alkaloidigena]SDM68330.1 hypothetical protein SAMN05421823_11947 [Catalinimonas alkaloidigena]
MKKLIDKAKAKETFHRLIAIERHVDGGFVMTDFERVYHLSDKESWDGDHFHSQSVWAHNQSWLLYEVDDSFTLPGWFDPALYQRVMSDKQRAPFVEGDGFCYTPYFNGYTGGHWYANNALEAVRCCRMLLNPLWDIALTPMRLVYDNGAIGIANKAMQIWKHVDTYFLTFNGSDREKRCNLEKFSKEALTLIKFATDSQPKWRNNKRWTHLLHFEGEIGAFRTVLETTHGSTTEWVEQAEAGDYYLIKQNWAGMYGGEGDGGESYFVFESKRELEIYLNEFQQKCYPSQA